MVVKVNLWGKALGYVAWDEKKQIANFQYDPDFIKSGLEVSPLLMPLNDGPIFSFPSINPETFKGLPGMIADVLPDDFGNAIINAWLLRNNRSIQSVNPVERLCYIGTRGMGALEFEPVSHTKSEATNIDIVSLVELSRGVLSKRNGLQVNLNGSGEEALETILRIGTSAGGARAKAIIAYNKETGDVLSGQANAPEGFEHYLIKFDGVNSKHLGDPMGFGRVEYSYSQMAKDANIEMSDCSFIEENGRFHFITKRFDRIGGKEKIHMQTLCGMTHMDYKRPNLYSYEEVFENMRLLKLDFSDKEQMFRRMCFNVIAKNLDDHTKNISFLMNKKGEWKLAPAYDITYSYDPASFWVAQHQLSVNGKRTDILDSDLLQLAKQNNIKSGDDIIDQIKSVVSNWPKYAKANSVPVELKNEIERNIGLTKKKKLTR